MQFEIEPISQHRFDAELFSGCTQNGQAKSYVFTRKRKQGAVISDKFSPSLPFKLSVQFFKVEDQDVELYVS